MKHDARPVWMLFGGSLLLLAAMAILASNASHVLTYRAAALRHGGMVVDASRSGPTAGNDGDMVLVTGTPKIVSPAFDRAFGIRADVPILWRITEMFQWRETDYGATDYELEWVDHPVDSSVFKQPAWHRNPSQMPFGSARFYARKVRLDGFVLDAKIIADMPGRQDFVPDFSHLRPNLAASFRVVHGALQTSENPASPKLGDLRVRWQAAPLQEVTVIARNRDGTLVPAEDVADAGFQLQPGRHGVLDMQPDLPPQPYLPWVWRLLSLLLALVGAYVLLHGTPWRKGRFATAAGIAVMLVCGLAGVMWFGQRSDIGGVLLGIAVLSLGITAWRMYEHMPLRR